jgi:hypothetical protein
MFSVSLDLQGVARECQVPSVNLLRSGHCPLTAPGREGLLETSSDDRLSPAGSGYFVMESSVREADALFQHILQERQQFLLKKLIC